MINGADIMVKCLEAEGVSVVFGYPGAAICPFYDSLYDSSIRHILVRQEQNAAHAANGYARASGKPGVCVATSGPGATNLITGIATAYTDSIPMVAITGQVRSDLLGRDVFQEADITGACEPFVKHSYLVGKTEDLPRVFKEAFHIASTGRPGPVLIDIPIDIQQNEIKEFVYPETVDIIGYKPNTRGHQVQIKRAIELLKSSSRPVIVAGGGVLSSGSKLKLVEFAKKTGIPVLSTMMGIGVMPSDHELYLGMLGTHGKATANRALHEADLVMVCGARLGDRAVAAPDQMSTKSKIIHIDIDPAEIGKNVKTTIPIVGDMKNVVNKLLEEIGDYHVSNAWSETLSRWKQELYRVPPTFEGFVEPRAFVSKLSSMLPSKAILVADVGQNQIWCANNFKIKEGR
ncbi:MAG TPA: acetolactate synthase, large subunit, biosynthetic type, partial [Candidatus Limousia pullorum]|nr:acetolactate synthase, large subunit, biosynthetic type [Candidatus Limousia pullorum]